ncbi:alpha-D-ribose 1-methylphosphonate 5-phosphate C-P lyase [Paenibacillus aceris]|uniref:Alpha-D-ribose 1-methylphosphonate 5-phosphate C-P lyase n=1 Tax=Paenibacillus aceris TaxID=869555 RepID=A0ABS4I0G7_9BACL|nr:alpha-D-ribose 1-methylphosphonate 5-phosphate C-P lyase [Paenibacillus aceris]
MQEFVGTCKTCGKQIFCREGFLDGVVLEDKSLICFACLEQSASIPD